MVKKRECALCKHMCTLDKEHLLIRVWSNEFSIIVHAKLEFHCQNPACRSYQSIYLPLQNLEEAQLMGIRTAKIHDKTKAPDMIIIEEEVIKFSKYLKNIEPEFFN